MARLLRHRVSAVVAGHYHQYERTCRVAHGECVPAAAANGTVFVTAGIAGLQHHEDWLAQTPPWIDAQATGKYGYLLLEVVNRTHAHLKAVDATRGDAVFDE